MGNHKDGRVDPVFVVVNRVVNVLCYLISCDFINTTFSFLLKFLQMLEKNPDPVMHHVDPSKTIQAPYSQGDVVVFGQNAGQQCVAMSLCALIYHNMKGIGNPNDLKQITHIGNQLNSSLSLLSRQSFLLLTDLLSMLTVLQEDY